MTAHLQEMVKSGTLPFVFDTQLPTRFGVLPRYAKNEDAIKWFEVPAVMMFHVANAWQEGNTVKLFSCCFDQVQLPVFYAYVNQLQTCCYLSSAAVSATDHCCMCIDPSCVHKDKHHCLPSCGAVL